MFKKIISFFKQKIHINTEKETVPEAFNFPLDKFELLVADLVKILKEEQRIKTFAEYLKNPLFTSLNLDLTNPNETLILGYAFCAAVILQKTQYSQQIVNKVLDAFYPQPKEHSNHLN